MLQFEFPTFGDLGCRETHSPAIDHPEQKIFFKSGETNHHIMKVFSWSLHACLQGCFPLSDHEGQTFQNQWRRKKQGTPLDAHAMLIEIRGDWLMYKQTFALPSWSEKSGRQVLLEMPLQI